MKNFKNKITSSLIALTLISGAVFYPKDEAKAAVVIGVGIPGIGSSLVGLGIFMVSVTFGVSMDIHPGIIGALCLLDSDLDENSMEKIESFLVNNFELREQTRHTIKKHLADNVKNHFYINNSDGSKSIVLSEEQFNDVMLDAENDNLSEAQVLNLKKILTHVPNESEIAQIKEQIQNKIN